MNKNISILIAQINPTVGAVDANLRQMIEIIEANQNQHEIIVFPELALTGYTPEDLLLRPEFYEVVLAALEKIALVSKGAHILLGHPKRIAGSQYNCLSIFYEGKQIREYYKQHLPNYEVFDDARYFTPGGQDPCVLELKGHKIGICICEDQWHKGPVDDLIAEGISLLISLNASPFHQDKPALRESLLRLFSQRGIATIYVNQIGGQDELLYDGQSLAMDKSGQLCVRLKAFEEQLATVQWDGTKLSGTLSPPLSVEALLYKALVCGTAEYVRKNHFPGVLLGLSGGIDSALTLCIAVDALGPEKVHAVLLPSPYTEAMSNEDAKTQIDIMGVAHSTLPITPIFASILTTLEPLFKDLPQDKTEENIQARIRGLLLMALSNKTGYMLLSTSNKSETAVGYATLYGDMSGGLAVLKDVLKTQVYALANYRNSLSKVIPDRVITRAPSAELKPNQTDQDELPDYEVLDAIITAYMQKKCSAADLIEQGFLAKDVRQVIQAIQRNEYKRRQAPPGIKVSPIAFGKDWRFPMTNGFESWLS